MAFDRLLFVAQYDYFPMLIFYGLDLVKWHVILIGRKQRHFFLSVSLLLLSHPVLDLLVFNSMLPSHNVVGNLLFVAQHFSCETSFGHFDKLPGILVENPSYQS